MAAKIISFIGFDLIGNIQAVNFLKILPVPLSKGCKFVITLPFLRLQVAVGILWNLLLVPDSLDVNVSIRDELSLTIEFSVELCILTFPIIVNGTLFVNLAS